MRDCLGNELAVGDYCVATHSCGSQNRGSELVWFTITRLTDAYVCYKAKRYSWSTEESNMRTTPNRVAKWPRGAPSDA